MTDVLQVKEEPTSVVRESRLPNLPSDLTENESPQEYLSLEQVANNTEKLRRFELLDRYLLQLSKGEHYGNFDVAKDANYLRKLVRSDDTHVQVKVSELLLQYFKLMKLNTQFDPKLGGIKDSMLLLKLYQVVHDDCCYYLLPNSKAGETFNKFLCNLLSTASSEYVFSSVVRLFQRTVENVLSKYNNVHSPSVSREMSTEDTRVVIGVMKTLLTLTRAFGSPPAPREVLCSLSVVVINSTNAHTCRVYSYNVAAFLIKDVVEEDTRRTLLKGLNEVQYNQVVALVKECNSLNNTCNWKFKYVPSDYVSSSVTVQSESNLSYSSDSSTNTTHTVNTNNTTNTSSNTTISSNIPTNSFSSGNTMASNSFSSGYSSNSHYSPSYSSVPLVPNVRKVVDSKKQQADASELPNNWYKDLFNTFESNRGEGKNVVVDKNAWKWKNDALLNTLKKLESVSSVEIESVSGQFSTLFESLFKYESAIPVVINSLNLFTVLTVKGNCDFLSLGKCQLLSDMLFEKLKENNKKVRDACVQSLVEVVKRSKLNVVSESVKKALVNVSPTCRENMCNFLNGKLLTTSDPEFYEKLQQLLSMLSEYMKQLTSEKVPKVKQAVLSVLDVLDNFSLVYSNQLTYSSMSTNSINSNTLSSTNNNSSLYSNMSTCSNFEDLSVSKDMESNYLNNNNREHQRSDNVSTNYSSTATGLPIVYSNNTTHTINTNTSTNNSSNTTTSSNIPTNSFSSGYSMINTNTSTSNSNNNVQDIQYTMTTTATSFVNLDSSTEFELESAERRSNFSHSGLEVSRPRGPMAVENLVDIVDTEVLDRFRVVDNKSLDEALYNLCLWMTDNMKLVKSVDFYLLKLMSEFYSSFTNKLTVDMFFSSLFSQPLSDDGFSEVLEFLKKYQDLKVLNSLLSKNNSNTNRLLNPLNNLYYSQVTTSSNSNTLSSTTNSMSSSSNVNLSSSNSSSSVNLGSSTNSNSSPNSTVDKVLLSVLELMSKYVSDENYTLVDEVVVKLVSFLAYFVKVKSESCSRLALDLLWSLNQRYEVSKYLDDELVASVTYSKPSKALSSAYLSSATRFEKYISKDLFMIMFQSDQDYKRRASYYWKGFVGDKTAKSRDMLEGKGRKDLTSWLSYCLFENMCHKYVVAGLELMSDYLLSKGLQFDAEESLLLTESLCSYGTFGRYQTKAMSVYHKMARCLSYSFEAVQFMFEYVEKASSQWVTVVSKALFNILEDAKKYTTSVSSTDKDTTRKDSSNTTTSTIKDNTKELVSYVSKRLEMSSKMSTYYKNKLRQWVELVSKSTEEDSIVGTTELSRVSQASEYMKQLTSEKVSRARTSETGNLVQTHEARNEIDEQLAATSLSEDSLRSKYFREENNTTSCSSNSNEKVYGTMSNRQKQDNDSCNITTTTNVVHRDERTELKELSKNMEGVENNRNNGSTTTSSVVSVEEHTDRDPTSSIRTKVVDSSRELESNKALQSTQSVLSSSKLDMETLETVHQDDYHSMEPVSTTDSNYENKANNFSSDFSYLSNQLTYRDTTEEPQKSYFLRSNTNNNRDITTRKDSRNTTTSSHDKVDWENKSKENENINKVVMEREYNTSRQDNSTNNNEDSVKRNKELSGKELVSEENKDSLNKQYVESQGVYTKELDNSVCPEVFYENKNMRVADREVVEDKGLNLVGQVLLDEDVNVDLDLESCRRLSQQIVDTPTSRLVEVPKRKSKDKYSQTEKSWGDHSSNNNKDNRYKENTDSRNEKRSCREENNTTSGSSNSNEEVYGSNNNVQDNITNTETAYKQDNVYSSVDMLTTSYSSRYDRQDKETQMSVSREFGKNSDSVSTRQDNSTNTTISSKDRVDRETEVSVVRQYDKQTSVNLLESSRRSEYYDRREVELTTNLEMNPEIRLEMDSRLKFNLESKGKEILTNVEMSNLPLTKYKEYKDSNNKYNEYKENTDILDKVDKQILEPDNTNKSSTSTSSSSKDTYPSVVVEFDSDLDFVSGEVYRLNLVETVLSHCSRVNNSCLVSSYKEYQKLADTLCPGNFSNTCLESCSQVLKYRTALKGSLLRLLSSPLVEMCHNAVLLLSKKLIKKLHSREQYDQTLDLEALTTTVEVFKIVTSDLQDKFVLQFCNVVTNLLSLPKDVYQNEKLYCLVSELVAENALKQSTDVMYKLLEVMVELSIESLEGDLDRLLMAKLRFTKILQMQILLTLKKNGNENSLDAETLKSKHINFIRRLETFANRRNAHNVEKVIQTSNYLISTI